MTVKSMDTAEEATASMEMEMEMDPRTLPHPDRVPKQRLLPHEICLQQWRCCGTLLGKTPIVLGFSIGCFI
jgi:hypothetical protein